MENTLSTAVRLRLRRSARRVSLRLLRMIAGVRAMHPARIVILGYLTYIIVGWIILCLPCAQRGGGANALDNLFIVSSAISTTGLVTVSVSGCYSLFGQIVILALIQLGGIGYMTVSSCLILARGQPLSPMRIGISQTVFSLPESFRIDKFIISVVKFTLLIEALGAVALYAAFLYAGVRNPLWTSIFHSVSSFCTAGFSLYNSSFESFAGNVWLNAPVAVLSYLGAIGFIVCVDVARVFRGKIKQITLTSRIILHATLWLTLGATLLVFATEPAIHSLPVHSRLLAAFFQCMSAMTTVGFNTVSIGALSKSTLLILVALMVIGASPSGTGGGLKVTTFTAVLGIMRSVACGRSHATFWGKPIPFSRLWVACASLGFYLVMLMTGLFLLSLSENAPMDTTLFEVCSALGTVGLSMGLTANLTAMGKIIVTVVMFCGRIGPITLGLALFHREGAGEPSDGDLAV